jgi:FkbM family methyltransferase
MPKIPNQFHFVFGLKKQREPFHLVHYLCLESCRRVNNPSAIYFYYHYEPHGPYWDAIRPYLTLEKVPLHPLVERFRYTNAAIRPFRYAHHSDFIRLEKLIERGGVYADMDTLFVEPLPPELFEKPFVMGRENEEWHDIKGWSSASLCNALMMSAPGAEFGRRWLERMGEEFDGSWSNHSTVFPQRLADQFPELIHIEPQKSFFHYPGNAVGLAALFGGHSPWPQGVYSMHLWAHLWWDELRTDFSTFHAGLLTGPFVEQQDTTYSLAARRFLPPASVVKSGNILLTGWRHIKRIAARCVQEVRAAAGFAIYPLLQRFSPEAKKRLSLAQAYYAHKAAVRKLTIRSDFEASILRDVIQWDEYNIFGSSFAPDDVVIDIGGHIGAFTFACHWLGSRNIHAFEADPGNFSLFQENLADLPGVHARCCAVFRSDLQARGEMVHSGPVFSNTGGGTVVFGGRFFEYLGYPGLEPKHEQIRTPVIALDDILESFDRVALLKLDCEGSEYPILLTSKFLNKVDRIVGEYHVIPQDAMPHLIPEARLDGHLSYGEETLRRKLTAEGFDVTITPSGRLGRFDAIRRASR